ncbi:hypothetical protein K493DRAFT_306677 [Basidiobolus meristosporus CBS 931.73]|uniref:Uncharacterized protein n=1 Tax=Basidiobolus meristosporus CBS 931.73 TaxID=1314790 RepID=A0A1Y1XRL3_9FUNG|nr:hypothetical protein K493DRAFT_306677 [Basidiobolus meristosporus CBS 931.73]|eukprot:ORX88377.1 hypothetical protein K493DRAFT_306677 [Basidiobolus meristosporus CBS 931.73]
MRYDTDKFIKEINFPRPKVTYVTFDRAQKQVSEFGDCGITEETVIELNDFLDEVLEQLVHIAGPELLKMDRLCTYVAFLFAFNPLGRRCVEEGKRSVKWHRLNERTNQQSPRPLDCEDQLFEVMRSICAVESVTIPPVEASYLSDSIQCFVKVVITTLGQYVIHSMILMAGKQSDETLDLIDLYRALSEDDQVKGVFVQFEYEKLAQLNERALLLATSIPSRKPRVHFIQDPPSRRKGLGKVLRAVRDNVQLVYVNCTKIVTGFFIKEQKYNAFVNEPLSHLHLGENGWYLYQLLKENSDDSSYKLTAPLPNECQGWRLTAPPNVPGLTWNTGTEQSISWDTGNSRVTRIDSVAIFGEDNSAHQVVHPNKEPAETWGSIEFQIPHGLTSGIYRFHVMATSLNGRKCALNSNMVNIVNVDE